jgi:bifunctional non-homologous end joining protein LigD
MPEFIKPQLATLKATAPKGDQWLHEIKFDGYRVQVHLNRGRKKVYTRNGLDWTKRFSLVAGALDIPGQAIIDGEVVVVKDGRTNFSELQAELATGQQDNLIFYAFDLLWRDGDLRRLPQIERKQALSDLLGENGVEPPIIYSEWEIRQASDATLLSFQDLGAGSIARLRETLGQTPGSAPERKGSKLGLKKARK